MSSTKLQDTYLGLDIEKDNVLCSKIDELCSDLNLTQRTELHITIKYFGQLDLEEIKEIGSRFKLATFTDKNEIKITGIGGLYLTDDNCYIEITPENLAFSLSYPRVLWFVVEQNKLISEILNLTLQEDIQNTSYFSPHITIGSGSGDFITVDVKTWDYHKAIKKSTLFNYSQIINAKKIHITSVEKQPKSLFTIKEFL